MWTLPSKLGEYLGDPKLTRQTQGIFSPLSSDEVIWALANAGHFFPSEYMGLESVENIFNANTDITKFDDFNNFQKVKTLESTFSYMANLKSIKLPTSIESIGAEAFNGCTSLETIYVGCDSVPQLAQDAFESLPENFSILVPNKLCKLYREKWAQYAEHINPNKMEFLDDIEAPDGIDTIHTIDIDGTEHYYDLNGRELPSKPERGIYIHNGKKYISK